MVAVGAENWECVAEKRVHAYQNHGLGFVLGAETPAPLARLQPRSSSRRGLRQPGQRVVVSSV